MFLIEAVPVKGCVCARAVSLPVLEVKPPVIP